MNPEDTLYARAPVRVDLSGAATDLSPYREEYGGQVLSVALRFYTYVTLLPRLDGQVNLRRLNDGAEWSGPLTSDLPPEGPLAPIRALVNRMGLNRGFDLFLSADLPPSSGLAVDASTGIATLAVLEEYAGRHLTDMDLARLYHETLREDLGKPFMRHEAFVSALGGFCSFEMDGDKAERGKFLVKESVRMTFEAQAVLVSKEESGTGFDAFPDLTPGTGEEQVKLQHWLKSVAQSAGDALAAGDLRSFVTFLDEEWQNDRQLFPDLVTPRISRLMETAHRAGARGGKVCGLNGNCLFFSCDDLQTRHHVTTALKGEGCTVLPFHLDEMGVEVWRQPQTDS